MKIRIIYCDIKSDHLMAVPEPTSSEIVEVSSWARLDKYILKKKKDAYGHPFKKDKSFGFRYTSSTGGIKVETYVKPYIKRI